MGYEQRTKRGKERRGLLWVVGLCILGLAATAHAQAPKKVGVHVGLRMLSDSDLPSGLKSQTGFGVSIDVAPEDKPVSFGGGVIISSSSDSGYDLTITEFYGEVRKTYPARDKLLPYVAGGLSLISRSVKGKFTTGITTYSFSESDTSIGLFGHGGFAYEISETASVGADARYVIGGDGAGLLITATLTISF